MKIIYSLILILFLVSCGNNNSTDAGLEYLMADSQKSYLNEYFRLLKSLNAAEGPRDLELKKEKFNNYIFPNLRANSDSKFTKIKIENWICRIGSPTLEYKKSLNKDEHPVMRLYCQTGDLDTIITEYNLEIIPDKVDELINFKLYEGDIIAFSGFGYIASYHNALGTMGSLNLIIETNYIKIIKESK
jgi:hypothetical protein